MAMHVKFLELRQNQFPFGINDSCKLDSSTRVQCNQAYFMKEVYFFQIVIHEVSSYHNINYWREHRDQYTKNSKYGLDQMQASSQRSNLNIKISKVFSQL